MANSISFIVPTRYLLILACNKAWRTLWARHRSWQWGHSLNTEDREGLFSQRWHLKFRRRALSFCVVDLAQSMKTPRASSVCSFPPTSCNLPRHTSQQHTEGLHHLQGERKTAPSPLTLGSLVTSRFPLKCLELPSRYVILAFLEGESFWCTLLLFGRPTPVWWPYVAALASHKPP